MSVAFVAFLWAFLQIGALCSVALSFAWLLRGRRPQYVTAMLAGTCLAALLLAFVALVPSCQWSVVIKESNLNSPTDPNLASAPTYSTESFVDSSSTAIVPSSTNNFSAQEASKNQSVIPTIRRLLSQTLQRLDQEVRHTNDWQPPIVKARNFSLGLLLAIGLTVMTLFWLSSWFSVRRLLKSSLGIDDVNLLNQIASQSRAFGLRSVPSVRESQQVPIGATVGWWRVTVLLHPDWREWTEQEASAVVAHELAHASRHDFFWVIVASWTRILLFFHPLVHALIRRLRMEQELAADQLAAGHVGNAKAYGRALASLALRSQQCLEAPYPKLGSMLTVGQICITRRVMMLRQGSLKPVLSRSRWSLAIVVAITCVAVPIAGLRGITQESGQQVIEEQSPSENIAEETAKDENPKKLSEAFLKEYPPVEFKGAMVYRPGRVRAGEFGPEVAWFQEWFTVSMVGRPIPDNTVAYGQVTLMTKWMDEERRTGVSHIANSFREGELTLPGQLPQFANMPVIGVGKPMRTVASKQVQGRTIRGVTNSPNKEEPEIWMVDDAKGFFLGTLDEARNYVGGQSYALKSVPNAFQEDYLNAAFAIVFADCELWHDQMERFVKGSEKEPQFRIPMQFVKDAENIGLFVDGCKSPACTVRATMQDASAAQRLVKHVKAMVEVGKLAIPTTSSQARESAEGQSLWEAEILSSLLNTLVVSATDSEVRFDFDIFAPSLETDLAYTEHNRVAGWQNINCHPMLDDTEKGTVIIVPDSMLSVLPSLFAQTLDATEYRGKTIALEMDIQCDENSLDQAGAFAWASRQESVNPSQYEIRKPKQQGSSYVGHRVLEARTSPCDGKSSFQVDLQKDKGSTKPSSMESTWQRVTVQLQVPSDAQHLSIGCYVKKTSIKMRNIKFQVTGKDDSTSKHNAGLDATSEMPFNVLIMPSYKIRSEPTNLNFETESPEAIRTASSSESVVR